MKKTFLIFGTLAGISATNAYADIVISQEQESPDVTITVARVANKRGGIAAQTTAIAVEKNSMLPEGVFTGTKASAEIRIKCTGVCIPHCQDIHDLGGCICVKAGRDPNDPENICGKPVLTLEN